MRNLNRIMIIIGTVLVSTFLLFVYESNRQGGNVREGLGPNARKAKSATTRMRNDIHHIRDLSDQGNWKEAHGELLDARRDWRVLVRDTRLTNENMINGLDNLERGIVHKEKSVVRREAKRMEKIVMTLEVVIKNDKSGK